MIVQYVILSIALNLIIIWTRRQSVCMETRTWAQVLRLSINVDGGPGRASSSTTLALQCALALYHAMFKYFSHVYSVDLEVWSKLAKMRPCQVYCVKIRMRFWLLLAACKRVWNPIAFLWHAFYSRKLSLPQIQKYRLLLCKRASVSYVYKLIF